MPSFDHEPCCTHFQFELSYVMCVFYTLKLFYYCSLPFSGGNNTYGISSQTSPPSLSGDKVIS